MFREQVVKKKGEFGPGIRLSRATPEESAAERADKILAKKAGIAAPIDAAMKLLTRVTGVERLTGAIYDRAAYLLDRYTPETIKAGVVSRARNKEIPGKNPRHFWAVGKMNSVHRRRPLFRRFRAPRPVKFAAILWQTNLLIHCHFWSSSVLRLLLALMTGVTLERWPQTSSLHSVTGQFG